MKILKKILKSIVIIPVYIILALEGCFGGCGTAKPKDVWADVVNWINK